MTHIYFLAEHWKWTPDALYSMSVRDRFELIEMKLQHLQRQRDKQK